MRTVVARSQNLTRSQNRAVSDDKPKAFGKNMKQLEGWRARLVEATGLVPYRQIAERAIGLDGRPLGYTTVRHVYAGPGTTTIETLAAICDAVGIDLGTIVGSGGALRALPPPGGAVPSGRKISIIPIVSMSEAYRWTDVAADPKQYEELFYTDADNAKELMAARVTDISMMDKFVVGDIVLFRHQAPSNGDDVIVQVQGQSSMLRRWKERPDGKVELSALNEEFGLVRIAKDRVAVLGVVTGFARSF